MHGMKVRRLKIIDLKSQNENSRSIFLEDFDVLDDVIYYSIWGSLFSMKYSGERKLLLYKSALLYNRTISIDKKLRLVVIGNNFGGVLIYRIGDNYGLEERIGTEIQLESIQKGIPNGLCMIRLNEKKKCLVIGFAWSGYYGKNDHDKEVHIIKDYHNKPSFSKLLFKSTSSSKAIQFTKKNPFIIVGCSYEERKFEDFRIKVFDYQKEKFLFESKQSESHSSFFRSLITFINSSGEEIIISTAGDYSIRIWKISSIDVVLLDHHKYTSELQYSLFVNFNNFVITSMRGEVFTYNRLTKEGKCHVPKDEKCSKTHFTFLGRCEWIGKSNIFAASCGDSTLRFYRVDGAKRLFLDNSDSSAIMKEDELERVGFFMLVDQEDGIDKLRVSFHGIDDFFIPSFFILVF